MDTQSPSQATVLDILSESIFDAVAESIEIARLHVKVSIAVYHSGEAEVSVRGNAERGAAK